MKIALFGGSFDPPHIGHCRIISKCLFVCDKLVVMPSKISPHKSNFPIASNQDRINMLEMMCSEFNGRAIVDHYELNSKNVPSYTIDAMNYVMEQYSPMKLYLVLGKDQYVNLKNWKSYENILSKTTIICIDRPGINGNLDFKCIFIDDVDCEISSSGIRSSMANNVELVKQYVSSDIFDYIRDKGLYI